MLCLHDIYKRYEFLTNNTCLFSGKRYDFLTNNMIESMNSCQWSAKKLPIVALLEKTKAKTDETKC